jgi:hypothetical protein
MANITFEEEYCNEGLDLGAGAAVEKGRRPYMEDRVSVHTSLSVSVNAAGIEVNTA